MDSGGGAAGYAEIAAAFIPEMWNRGYGSACAYWLNLYASEVQRIGKGRCFQERDLEVAFLQSFRCYQGQWLKVLESTASPGNYPTCAILRGKGILRQLSSFDLEKEGCNRRAKSFLQKRRRPHWQLVLDRPEQEGRSRDGRPVQASPTGGRVGSPGHQGMRASASSVLPAAAPIPTPCRSRLARVLYSSRVWPDSSPDQAKGAEAGARAQTRALLGANARPAHGRVGNRWPPGGTDVPAKAAECGADRDAALRRPSDSRPGPACPDACVIRVKRVGGVCEAHDVRRGKQEACRGRPRQPPCRPRHLQVRKNEVGNNW